MAGRAGSVEIMPVKTSGDRIQDRPLAEVGGKALWTKELDLALLAGETDCSVHSMKDVESERPDTLAIAAMLPRADVRDRLIGADSIAELAARRAWSAPARRAAPRSSSGFGPTSRSVSIRGNVDTRLAKLEAGEVDATLLAAAGLDRLGRADVGIADRTRTKCCRRPRKARSGSNAARTTPRRPRCCRRSTMPTRIRRCWPSGPSCRALGGTCHSPVAANARIDGGRDRLCLRDVERGRRRADLPRTSRFRGRRSRSARTAGPADAGRGARRRSAACSRADEEAAPASARAGPVGQRRAGAGAGSGRHRLPAVPRRAGGLGRARSDAI